MRLLPVALVFCLAVCLAAAPSPAQDPAALPLPVPVQPQPPADGPVSVPSGVMARMLLHSAQPSYPDEAWAKGIQGQVVVRAIIGKDGRIGKVEAVSGPEELRAAALHAVSLWRYKPYVLDGQPIEVETKILMDFHLSGSPLRQ